MIAYLPLISNPTHNILVVINYYYRDQTQGERSGCKLLAEFHRIIHEYEFSLCVGELLVTRNLKI